MPEVSEHPVSAPPTFPAYYFDGTSSRRRPVTLQLSDRLDILQDGGRLASWPLADLRRADGAPGVLRLACVSAPALARLEISGSAAAQQIAVRCDRLDRDVPQRHGVFAIVAWSLAAIASLVLVSVYGMPLIADRLAPLLPQAFERRVGEVADQQVRALFGSKVCDGQDGQAALAILIDKLRGTGPSDEAVRPAVLSSEIANAIALPGGRVYLFSALLDKAESPDEIAGVLAHEFGHVARRDNIRHLIREGGTSFLIGLLFGDISGSGALVFATRALINSSYSREAEHDADSFAIGVMQGLGRPVKPMGELLFRVTGKQSDSSISILASHPLTEDRLARMSAADAEARGAPLLSPAQWQALKSICSESR